MWNAGEWRTIGKAGARALSDWLRRCRAKWVRSQGLYTFLRLMKMLVNTAAAVWGGSMGVRKAAHACR